MKVRAPFRVRMWRFSDGRSKADLFAFRYIHAPEGWVWRYVPIFDATPNVYGELDGVFGVTGFGQSAENTVTINGIPHLVVPDVFRGGKANFHAVRLA